MVINVVRQELSIMLEQLDAAQRRYDATLGELGDIIRNGANYSQSISKREEVENCRQSYNEILYEIGLWCSLNRDKVKIIGN